jgi:large subunit ribosomal protein L11
MPAWKATPAPPIGPILWQHGINIGAFVKEFNDKTMETMQAYWGTQVKVPVNITVYIDRSYGMEILPPVTSDLIKWKAGVNKGAAEPNKWWAGTVSKADLEELIDIKLPVMNTRNRESILKSFMGTAKSLWIKVTG